MIPKKNSRSMCKETFKEFKKVLLRLEMLLLVSTKHTTTKDKNKERKCIVNS